MRTHPLRPNSVLALTCLLAILLYFLDIAVPQAQLWGSYLLPIVLTFLWGSQYSSRRDIYLVTALASLLVVAMFWTDGTLSRDHEGLGFGLAYVDQMVHLMGGTLALESTPGEGSRFTVTLSP